MTLQNLSQFMSFTIIPCWITIILFFSGRFFLAFFFSSLVMLLESFRIRRMHLLWVSNRQACQANAKNLWIVLFDFIFKRFLVLINLFFREAFSLLQGCRIWRLFKKQVLKLMHKYRVASLFTVSLTRFLKKQSPIGV